MGSSIFTELAASYGLPACIYTYVYWYRVWFSVRVTLKIIISSTKSCHKTHLSFLKTLTNSRFFPGCVYKDRNSHTHLKLRPVTTFCGAGCGNQSHYTLHDSRLASHRVNFAVTTEYVALHTVQGGTPLPTFRT